MHGGVLLHEFRFSSALAGDFLIQTILAINLLLESQRRNGKVNNGDFDTGFRGVMRIGQRGGQKQLKIFIITDLLNSPNYMT